MTSLRVPTIIAMAMACGLMGCAGPKPLVGPTAVSVVDSDALPPPTRADLNATDRAYLIGPFDKLKIGVFGIEELTDIEIQTDASGRISFPLAGVVEAAGRTPGELASELEARLRGRYVRDPQVTVNLEETVSQVVTIDGQVVEPGLYPVIGRMTLMRTVATAKGLTEFAQEENVVIFRTVNGVDMAALYNLGAIRRGYYKDPEVYANDVVIVSNSRARRIFRDVLQSAPLLTAPLIAILSNRN